METPRIHSVRNHARAARPRGAFGRAISNVIHFIGIGGIGMSALARWFMAQGWRVSGSDAERSDLIDELRKEGVTITIGTVRVHKSTIISPSTALVVRSQAIRALHPEMVQARTLKISILTYPEAVGALTKKYKTIAVAGSHGKSTTTALMALVMIRAGLDPTVIVGTKLKELKNKPRAATSLGAQSTNFREGNGQYLVLEADEFGRAFWHYSPTLAIITNIDREHLDIYKNLAGVKKGFLKFISQIKIGGVLVLNHDDKNTVDLKPQILRITNKKKIKVIWYTLRSKNAKKIKKVIAISGVHNVSNALAVYALAKQLKIPERTIIEVISWYHGAWRRMEYRGEVKISNLKSQISDIKYSASSIKLSVFDDYAHHPTEIKATLQAFKEKYPESPLVCVFQPHQAARLKVLFKEFRDAFESADIAIILPTYNPMGRDKIEPKYDSETLVKAIQHKYSKKRIFYLSNPKNLKNALATLLENYPRPPASHQRSSAILVMMGAGSIADETKRLFS